MSKVRTKVYALGKRRKLTLAGCLSDSVYPGTISYRIAMAIRNPEDGYYRNIGITIATNRLLSDKKDLSVFEGVFDTLRESRELNYIPKSIMEAQMDVVAEFIKHNIDKFI